MVPEVSGVVKALQDSRQNVADQIDTLSKEWEGKQFDEAAKKRYNDLNAMIDEYDARIELQLRDERKAEIKRTAEKNLGSLELPQVRRANAVADDQIYDMSTIVFDPMDPAETGRALKDRASRSIERMADRGRWDGSLRVNVDDAQTRCDRLLRDLDTTDGKIARHLLVTGSPEYRNAFRSVLFGGVMTPAEENALQIARAMSLTAGAGGYAVPYDLDPTVIPASNLAINPYRAISRIVNTTVDTWQGVVSTGITAAYAAEATSASDVAPSFTQPQISTEKARAFVPFSIEIGQDWGAIQTELGQLLSDSKDELEATKFTLGSGSNEPKGIITAATTVYTAAATSAITAADIFGWQAALGARFRPRASFVMNIGVQHKIRQFDTTGGSLLWSRDLTQQGGSAEIPTTGRVATNLLGAPVYESSAMSQTFTTGQLIGVYGDFNYYVIVERLGLTVEVIPHLFDVTANAPTGQRGLYAYWRNGADVASVNAFRVLKLA